jgi:hypothetical protein
MPEDSDKQGMSVHAGFPNPAADMSLGNLDINKLLITNVSSTYIFRVLGDGWEDMGIFDRDIAIIDRSLSAHKSDIVVWWGNDSEKFNISICSQVPEGIQIWGVITATIHQFRNVHKK